jgi:hypothetical protein
LIESNAAIQQARVHLNHLEQSLRSLLFVEIIRESHLLCGQQKNHRITRLK